SACTQRQAHAARTSGARHSAKAPGGIARAREMAAGAGGGWSAASAVALHARARRRGPARTGRALLLGAAAAGAALASARAVLREAGRSFAAAGGRPDEGVVQGAGGPRGARRREWLAAAGAAGVAGPTPARASEISVFGANLDLSFLDPKAPEDYNKPPADAEVFPSGLVSKILLRPQCALSKFTPPEKLAKCPKAKPYDKAPSYPVEVAKVGHGRFFYVVETWRQFSCPRTVKKRPRGSAWRSGRSPGCRRHEQKCNVG
ncbi:unnamed protein product, partial [Prorocentrum cordatum]